MSRMVVVTFSKLPHSSLLNFFGFVILGYIFHHWQHSCIDSFFFRFFQGPSSGSVIWWCFRLACLIMTFWSPDEGQKYTDKTLQSISKCLPQNKFKPALLCFITFWVFFFFSCRLYSKSSPICLSLTWSFVPKNHLLFSHIHTVERWRRWLSLLEKIYLKLGLHIWRYG